MECAHIQTYCLRAFYKDAVDQHNFAAENFFRSATAASALATVERNLAFGKEEKRLALQAQQTFEAITPCEGCTAI